MELTPDITEVRALDNYCLYLKFKTGEEKIYNMEDSINRLQFYSKLKNKSYFKKVKVRGDTVEWENGEDVAPEKLYYESLEAKKF